MSQKCQNRVCPYCAEIVSGWPDAPGCCGEAHAYECGDEGRVCPDCLENEATSWRAYFGLLPGMNQEQRRAQLEAFRPKTDSELAEEMAEARRLK